MLEVGIIICIAAIIILLLRKYPGNRPSLIAKPAKKKVNMPSLHVNRLFARKRHIEEDEIRESLEEDQQQIVSPREIEEAKQEFDAEDPEIAKLLRAADEAIRTQDYNTAEEKAIEVLSLDQRCDQAYSFVAYVALKRGELENAAVAAKTALKCNPESAEAYAVIGEIDLTREKYTEAIDNLLKAVMQNRNKASWYGLLGQAYMEVRQFAKSAKAFKRAASLDLDNREYRRLASIAEEKQQSHSRVFRAK